MTIAAVQSISGDTSTSSVVLTFGSSTVTGNGIIAVASVWNPPIASIVDSKLNTYTARETCAGSGGRRVATIWETNNITGGAAHAVTVTQTGSFLVAAVLEISGENTSGGTAFDVGDNSGGNAGTSHTSGSTGTLSSTDEIVILAGSAGDNTSLGATIDTSSDAWSSFNSLHVNMVLAAGYLVVSATTAKTGTWSAANQFGSTAIAAFKGIGGSPPAVTPRLPLMGAGT